MLRMYKGMRSLLWPGRAASVHGPRTMARVTLFECRTFMSSNRKRDYPREGMFQQPSPPVKSSTSVSSQPPDPDQSRNLSLKEPLISRFTIFAITCLTASAVLTGILLSSEVINPIDPDSLQEDTQYFQTLCGRLASNCPLYRQLSLDALKPSPRYEMWLAYGDSKGGNNKHGPYLQSRGIGLEPLRGTAGVAAQIVFWSEQDQRLLIFICFGGGTAGWPAVVHGGAIATVLDEALGRAAARKTEQRSAVTAQLKVDYISTISPARWMLVDVQGAAGASHRDTESKKHVRAQIVAADSVKSLDQEIPARPHAVAEGIFVVPKSVKLTPIPEDF